MSNPDGHFTDDNAEYLHWMVGNIPCDGSFGTEETDIARLGENICPYLQPFPPYGTGFHRFVFILYKHVSERPSNYELFGTIFPWMLGKY